MADLVLDHIADRSGVELHRLFKLYDIPDFVKSASEDTLRPGPLPDSVYADPRTKDKLYPCQDGPSTYLSCLFFEEKQAEFKSPRDREMIRERLDKMAEYWGITDSVEQMRARHVELNKNATDMLPDSDFAMVRVFDNGTKERHWRIKNAKEVRAAAEALFKHRDLLPWSDRHTISKKILEKAAQYGASLGKHEVFIERQAGRGVCNPDDVINMLHIRAKLANDSNHRQMIMKLAKTIDNKPSSALTPDMLIKLAETVDTMDRASGLIKDGVAKYTDVIRRPEDVIFSATYKEVAAGASTTCALTTGSIYDKTHFSKISMDDLANLFGPDIAKQVGRGLDVDPEKMAEIAETLPRPDAELFESLLKETGIPPMAHKMASAGAMVGLSPTMLESLAKNYARA